MDKYYEEVQRKLGHAALPTARRPLRSRGKSRPVVSPIFKKGDRVKIVARRPDTIYRPDGVDFHWAEGMDTFLGQSAKIVAVMAKDRAYEIDVDSGRFGWGEEWLSPDQNA